MKKHFWYYISFLLILGAGLFLIAKTNADKQFQMSAVLLLAFLYIVWGTLHHAIHHSITVKIVLEYVVVAMLGASVVFFVLKGGL
ncbi:MAG: hypothetical protein ACREGI_05150 [Candidatus Levyibacteriota bacterium]